MITWEDWRNGDYAIFAQRYSRDGRALGSNFMVVKNASEKIQFTPDVKLWNGRIYNTWTDNRAGGTGYDIWANVLDWNDPVGISDNEWAQLPLAFILNQNYPNPFNPSTNISYSLPKPGFVILKIYDILGKEIQTLVNEYQRANIYTVQFIANDLASGIYFYTLHVRSNFVETKKMVLIR